MIPVVQEISRRRGDRIYQKLSSAINFAIYLVSFLANTLVIITAPKAALREYVLIYNIASVVYSLSLFLYYSKYVTISRTRIIIVITTILIAVGSLSIGLYYTALFVYPGIMIFLDYLITQSFRLRIVNIFRVLMILSAIPFLVVPSAFAWNLIGRVAALLVITVILAMLARESGKLTVRSPLRFVCGTYLFYNGPLLSLALVVHDPARLRVWYLACQIGLVLILKLLDYSLRRSYTVDSLTRYAVLGAAGVVPIPLLFVYPEPAAFGLFYAGYFGLIFTSRYIHR